MHLLEKMQSENIYSDSVTHICSLKICNSLGLREKGQEVHMEIVKSGLETDCFTNNALVDMYSKFGSFDETWKLVENLQLQNTVAWTSIITGCADHGCNELALLHLREMQLAGFSPDGMTFASSLKACGRIKDIDTGTDIHDEIFKKGFDDDPFLGNVLVDMYIKCNLLVEAEIVFHSLPIKDLISWNTLINGCIEGGINGKALKYLEQMPAYGICPDNITFMCILRLCASMSDIERGKKIHSEIIMKGFETEEFVHSNLVDMYAKCGMLSEAIKVCRRFSSSYVVAWNSLIAEYIERGYVDDALECLEDIKQSGIDFDAVTFASSLRIFKIIGSVTSIYCLHSEIIKSGLDTDPLIGNIIIDSYVKCGSCIEAEKSFEKLVHRDVTSWNAIMSVYIHSRSEEKLSGCLEQMSFEGISPDCVTFTLLLKESSISGFTERGHKLHSLIIKSGFDEDLVIQTTLVGLYGNHGSLEESQTVFDRIGLRDVVAWTALITGYANLHMWDEVLNCFEIIKVEGISPDANTWAYLIQAYGCMGEIKEGQKIHAEIVRRGLEEESNIHNNLISMYRKFELHLDSSAYVASPSTETGFSFGSILTDIVIEELGVLQVLGDCLQVNSTLFPNVKQHFFFSDIGIWELHTEVLKRGLDTYCSFSHGLMHIYVQCCRLEEVEIIFDTLMYKDIISWNSLIKACIECGSSDRALQYFQNMQVESMTPDANTYLLRSEACQDVGDLNLARQLHSEIIMKGLEKDSFLSSNLLDMYGKNGRFLDAQKVFDGLKSPDVVSWTAVIAAYVNSGLSEDGLRLLEKMLQQGICPNVITYGVITKLYGIRKSTNGCLLLHAEITKKGFDSDTFLCNSLVDMYIKCGLLMEIQDFIKQLPYRDVILFTTLIVGYYEHGKYEEVFNTFKRMQSDRVRPNHVTYSYTLNACAKAAEILLGKAIHVEVIKYGFEGDHVVGDSLILMYASSGLYDEALYVLHNLPAQDTVSWNMLIECYVDHGFFNEAVDFFHLMLQQGIPADQILWNTIIMAYIDLGESENAFIKYSEMLQQGVLPDDLIFVALSKACGNIASIEVGRRLHAQFWVESESQSPRGNFAHALIDMYGKCGSILESQRIFHSRPMEDAIAWNFALASYIRQGDCVSALYIYSRMQEKHIDLNESVLLNLLTLCSHGGLVYRGQLLFENFCTIMKILPSVEYFTCIIDLLARAGQLEEASAIIDFLPSSPDHVPYNCLLSAWQRSNDVELGG
ncbi:hypothetical protein KP509_19G054900 [Ceratopteris richardii]|nr:hypothetical protein KP509_19G054900 [Ceratopteris richardii]